MATIETKAGEWKKILIEVQKSWDETDVKRFRNYLAEQYRRVDRINGEDIVLPHNDDLYFGRQACRHRKPLH
ncbi:MAG: hypothetical protein LBS03_04775 [Bacteroidales bacterium]|jgi:hypothetical protein|nr:hypothetical protein [Bacteroidales bacterium]